jgi:hypothetical protein
MNPFVFFVLAAFPACGNSHEETPDAEPPRPLLPLGGCGTAEYSLLPLAQMGRIVNWEYMTGLSVNASFIAAALEDGGIEGFTPEYGVHVYRLRYVTQDKGREVETTGLLSYPRVETSRTFPTVLWMHGTTGFNDACAPSALGFEGAIGNILLSSLGYVVMSPDYLGMNGMGASAGFLHPYLQAEATAFASLDGLRALQRFERGEGDPDLVGRHARETVLWGGSEGGFAAFWSDRYWKGYAPSFDLVATVAIVPPTDLLALAVKGVDEPRPTTGALAATLVALNQWHGDLADLSTVLTDEPPHSLASRLPEIMATECGDGDAFDGLTEVSQIYRQAYVHAVLEEDWDSIEPWSCYLRLGTLNRTEIERGHDTPVFFVVSGADNLVVAETQRKDFGVLCDMGYRMEYLECADASHSKGAVQSLPGQLAWVEKRLAGEPLSDAVCRMGEAVACDQTGGK